MSKKWTIEPRSERAGLFSEETSLIAAVKELNNPKLSIKRSTRGYTLLLENKPTNPVIAGKNRLIVENTLHDVHCRYIKYLAKNTLNKLKLELISEIESENTYEILFKGILNREIKISVNKLKWEIDLNLENIQDRSDNEIILNLVNKIGKTK